MGDAKESVNGGKYRFDRNVRQSRREECSSLGWMPHISLLLARSCFQLSKSVNFCRVC